MKKNILRILCLLVAIAMCLSFAGCEKKKKSTKANGGSADIGDDVVEALDASDISNEGVGGSGSDAATAKEKVSANADDMNWSQLLSNMPKDLKGSTVTVYSWNPIKDVSGAENVVANFQKQAGIKVNWIQGSYDNYDTEILAKIKAGDSPDMIRYNYPAPARMSLCQDIKTATGSDCKGAVWDSTLTNVYTVKGKIYGVNLQNTFNQQPAAVAYKPSDIKRYKLEDPYVLWKSGKWNFNKFIDMCKQYKDRSGYAGWMTSRGLDYLWFTGVQMIKFDGNKYTNNIKSQEVITAIQKICNFQSDGIMPEAQSEAAAWEGGAYLFYTSPMLEARRTDFHFPTLKKNNDLIMVPFPTGAGSTYYTNYQEYEAYGVPKGAKNGIGAYYFMRYYLDRANYDASTFFVNSQTLECYDYLRKVSHVNYQTDRALTAAIGDQLAGINTWIRTGGKAEQVKTQIDKVAAVYDRAVDQGNKTIANF